MLLEQMLEHAKKVAFRMSRDPEVESLAGLAAWRAFQTYDATKSHWTTWTGRLVKQEVIMYWRHLKYRRETQMSQIKSPTEEYSSFDGCVMDPVIEDSHEKLVDGDWQLLCEYYIDRYPLDVVARRNNMSLHTARKTIAAAVARLEHSTEKGTFV
jgi:DNA-directed RNA polymerase specialized sigma24 family protein